MTLKGAVNQQHSAIDVRNDDLIKV